jgi:hypothetical protein
MLDCDKVRKDAVRRLDSVTRHTAVPSTRVRRCVLVYFGRTVCSNETHSTLFVCLCTLGGLCAVMRRTALYLCAAYRRPLKRLQKLFVFCA